MNSEFLFDLFCDDLTEGLRPAFGSPGGKRLLSSKIIPYFPEHQRYCEPFIGGGAVFWKKKPSQEEIINDKDSEIAFAYKFLKGLNEEKFDKLEELNWHWSEKNFNTLKELKPKNDEERFHKHLLTTIWSFGSTKKGFARDDTRDNYKQTLLNRLPKLSERLKGVKIYNKDWKTIVEEYDGKNTFFYFDPPYYTQKGNLPTDLKSEDINNFCKKIKGKFLMSYAGNNNERRYFPDFSCKNLKVSRTPTKQGTSTFHEDNELLLSNFGFSKNNNWLAESVLQEFNPARFQPEELQKLNDLELIQRHAEIVRIWKERGARANDEMAINSHALVVAELKRRGLEHRYNEDIDKLSDSENPVKPVDGKYTLEDALKFFQTDFYLKDPFLALTGGTVVSGEGHDWDMWVNWNNPRASENHCPYCERFLQQLRFRLQSQLPEELQSLIHLVPETEGKFTNYTPLARMKIEFLKPEDRTLMRMSLTEQAKAGSEDIKKQAEQSLKENKIKMFRFFYGMKPTRSAVPNERMTKEFFMSLFDIGDFPVWASKKMDGMRVISYIDNKNNKIEVWSEDGENITDRIPNIVKELSKIQENNLILDSELEYWHNGKHYPREKISGYIHSTSEPDDSNLVMNVFTLLFFNDEDLHDRTETERQERLSVVRFENYQHTQEIPDTKIKINIIPNVVANNDKELSKAFDLVSGLPASEGIVAKKANSKYFLDINSREGWIKFHKNALLYGMVIERIPTKVKDVFNYRYGIKVGIHHEGKIKPEELIKIDDENIVEVGKTFSTSANLERGDKIAVEFETFNITHDERDDTYSFSAWVPRFIPLDKTQEEIPSEIDNTHLVIENAGHENIDQFKIIKIDGTTFYESFVSLEDEPFNEIYKNDFSFLSNEDLFELQTSEAPKIQEEKRPLEEYPKNYAILVNHFRGKSVHADFRRRQNGSLEGETIMNGPAGLITETVETIEQGKKWSDILIRKGKFRPDMNPNQKVVMVSKASQPLEWLNVREVKFEPGEIGATKEHYGVFFTMDEGMAYPGVQKPYFREFFLDMKHFKGRMVERAIGVGKEWEKPPTGQAVQWQTWTNMVEQTPYLLTSRGRERREDVPPDGVSWLPPEWEEKVPVDMRWWKPGLSKEQKLDLMDKAYNSLIASGELKDKPLEIKEQTVIVQEKKAKFILRWHWWKGQEVVRDMPAVASHWDLVIDSGKEYLDEWNIWQDPVRTEKATANRKITNLKSPMGDSIQGWMDFSGSIPSIDSKVQEVQVIKETSDGIYSVVNKKGDRFETKETYAKFKTGQTAYLDQYKNLFTGKLGGASYGNPLQKTAAYMEILDSGNVEWLEDNANFASFKFNGKILDGYYVMKRESPESTIWTFSKSKLPGESVKEEISVIQENRTIKVSNLIKPVDINFNGREYVLIPTSSGKLRLDTKNK